MAPPKKSPAAEPEAKKTVKTVKTKKDGEKKRSRKP